MREFLQSIARPAIRRLAPLTFIKSAALRENPEFLSFLNFGMRLDHAPAPAAVEWFVECRTQWAAGDDESRWQGYSQDAKLGYIREFLFSVVKAAAAKIPPSGPTYLGLSGGLDSRSILHVLNARHLPVKPYTHGQPGNRDFDIVRELGRRTGQEATMFDTNRMDWRLDDFVAADFFRDFPVSPRVPAHVEITRLQGSRAEWHGYLNDRLTGNRLHAVPSATWGETLARFEKECDAFGFQQFVPATVKRSLLPDRPITDRRALSFDEQLAFGYRLPQRTMPCDGPGVTFVLPYRDAGWAGFWLNRHVSDRVGQKLYIAAARSLNAPEFYDLSSGDATTNVEFREQQLHLLYGPHYKKLALTPLVKDVDKIIHPIGPAFHFCLFSCYANNPGFRRFADRAMEGLEDMAIFDPAFVRKVSERFRAGSREGIKMMDGLISTYIQYRCGRFTE